MLNAQVLGISMDSVEANAAFAQKYQFPYPLLSDSGGQVCRAYDTCTEAGEIRRNTVIIGPDRNIEHFFEDVQPEGHVETVLAFLEAAAMTVAPTKDQRPQINLKGGQHAPRKGAQAKMDEQQHIENGAVCQVATLDRPGVPSEELPEGQVERVTPSAPTPSGVAAAAATVSPESLPAVWPGQIQPAQASGGPSLVFALGTLGYDFGTEARRDSIAQHMAGPDNPAPNPQDPTQLLAYLEANPDQAAAVIWTLSLDATPIYAVSPNGPFAAAAYERLRQFLGEQLTEGVERVSIPGVIAGQIRLMSGQTMPVIIPELRCMYSWSTAALIEAVCGKAPSKSAKAEEQETHDRKTEAVANFLQRIYHELRNLGLTSQERAMNYAGANLANANDIFESALKRNLELHSIDVAPSPICRPDSDCWDVKLLFFDPENVLRAKTVYQFTVDVSDVCPVMVGPVRSWSLP
jgi:cyanobactin maturation PatA/PatG family protease